MRQSEIESLVSSIKQLNAVLVVMVPDCLLYSAWQRSGQNCDTEGIGAFVGELVRSTDQGIQAIEQWSGSPASITLESTDSLLAIRQVSHTFVVAYVFEPDTAIGWARLQIQRTLPEIENGIQEETKDLDKPSVRPSAVASAATPAAGSAPNTAAPATKRSVPSPPRPAAVKAPATARPAPSPAPPPKVSQPSQGAIPPAPPPAAPQPSAVPGLISGAEAPSAPRATKPAPRPAMPQAPKPAVPSAASGPLGAKTPNRTNATSVSAPAPAVKKPEPERPAPTAQAAAPAASAQSADSAAFKPADSDPTPKGTRLIKYLDTHAPDTHAALLRVSLQTGLPLTLLRMPDSLSDDEFAQVEESVRRILGVDQLNF